MKRGEYYIEDIVNVRDIEDIVNVRAGESRLKEIG